MLQQLKEFELSDPNMEQQMIQSILQVEANMEFHDKNREPLRRWIHANADVSRGVPGDYSPAEVMADDPRVHGRVEFHPPRWIDWNQLDNDLFPMNWRETFWITLSFLSQIIYYLKLLMYYLSVITFII